MGLPRVWSVPLALPSCFTASRQGALHTRTRLPSTTTPSRIGGRGAQSIHEVARIRSSGESVSARASHRCRCAAVTFHVKRHFARLAGCVIRTSGSVIRVGPVASFEFTSMSSHVHFSAKRFRHRYRHIRTRTHGDLFLHHWPLPARLPLQRPTSAFHVKRRRPLLLGDDRLPCLRSRRQGDASQEPRQDRRWAYWFVRMLDLTAR